MISLYTHSDLISDLQQILFSPAKRLSLTDTCHTDTAVEVIDNDISAAGYG